MKYIAFSNLNPPLAEVRDQQTVVGRQMSDVGPIVILNPVLNTGLRMTACLQLASQLFLV